MLCTGTALLLSPGTDTPRATTASPTASSTPGDGEQGMEPHLRYLSGKLHLISQILASTTSRHRTRMCPRQPVAINNYQVFFQVFLSVFCSLTELKPDLCNTIAGDEVMANPKNPLHNISQKFQTPLPVRSQFVLSPRCSPQSQRSPISRHSPLWQHQPTS